MMNGREYVRRQNYNLFHFLDQFEGFGEGDHKYGPLKLVRRAVLNKQKQIKVLSGKILGLGEMEGRDEIVSVERYPYKDILAQMKF
jgi:hypothetical protein